MNETALVTMERCESGCGVLVRGGGYCSKCEELGVHLERRRLEALERWRNVGRAGCCAEAASAPVMACSLGAQEWLQVTVAAVVVLALGSAAALCLFEGAKVVLGWLVAWWAAAR